jgi:HK97 gp10 family phage protein
MAANVVITKNIFARSGAEEAMKSAIVQTLIQVHANGVALAPVDLGQLRNSIMWRKSWGSDSFGYPSEGGFNSAGGEAATDTIEVPTGELEGVVGSAVEYATYQEFGTRWMAAQPFMRPAADAVRGFSAAAIARKWGPEAMRREYAKRKRLRLV